jgi:small GTP-binding protein
MSTPDSKTYTFKLVLMGESGVGKSSIALRMVSDTFNANTEATIGASFFSKIINTEHESLHFKIWDTAGQEKYHCLVPMYYRGSDAALVVYDITDESSYKLAKRHVKELKENSDVKVIAFIGNKCDRKVRVVSETDAKLYANSQKLLYIETSAKLNINIINILNILGDELPRIENPPPAAPDMQLFSDFSPPKPGCCG